MFSPFLGKDYSNEIMSVISSYREQLVYERCTDVCQDAASAIAEGKIVGWFQGRSDCGPRSLGNRSILAEPRNPDMKDYLNKKVKFREEFRPFAPSVLWEHQKEYFDLDIPSPYMLMVADILHDKQSIIPAVTHVDGTGRLQTVMKDINPLFHRLIEKFYKITGVPVVLNTSFNVKGEPIVETPQDAIKCFLGTGIDVVYMHNYCLKKRG